MCSLRLTHPRAHTHLEQWTADAAAPGEQSGVRCLAQGSHLSREQFLPEPRYPLCPSVRKQHITEGKEKEMNSVYSNRKSVTYQLTLSVHFIQSLGIYI